MERDVVVTLDIGTSSVRAILFDTAGRLVQRGLCQKELHPQTSAAGEAILDADDLVDEALACLHDVVSRSDARPAAVASATFWHSVLGIDAAGRACTPLYLWSDTRSAAQVESLRAQIDERAVHARTGCRFHTSYLPARLMWLKQTRPEEWENVAAWLSPGEYLYLRLFGDRLCSFSMASGTGLLNQQTLAWDRELLDYLELPEEKLSPLIDIDHSFRNPEPCRVPALQGIPWYPALGDGACSNVGSGGVRPDRVTLMVGTSGAMRLLGDGNDPAPGGLWRYRLDRRRSLTGGALSNGGLVYRWLRGDSQAGIGQVARGYLATSAADSHGLTVLPFLWGERSPDWFARATGAILGLTEATRPRQIFQAALEAVAYRFRMVYGLLAPLAAPDHVLLGSGAALRQSRAWAQMMADALNRPLILSDVGEGTARGAALMALEQLGAIEDIGLTGVNERERLDPDPERHEQYARGLERHRDAINRLQFQ